MRQPLEASIYVLISYGPYLLSLLLTAGLTWVMYRLIARPRGWGAGAVLLIAGGVILCSNLPAIIDRLDLRRDLAAYAPDEIRPASLSLPPGSLLHIRDDNHAGITCSIDCPFDTLPFVTGVTAVEDTAITDATGEPDTLPVNLWALIEGDRGNAPFPYDYIVLSVPTYWYATAIRVPDDRKPSWPEGGKGAHMLIKAPADGLLDLTTAETLYRRFNIQTDLAEYLSWGFKDTTEHAPTLNAIFQDIQSITQPD